MKSAKRVLSLILVLVCLLTAVPMARAITAADLPKEIFLTQEQSGTCTLCSTAMMIRSCLYIHGNNEWSAVTESSIKNAAWLNGVGLKWSFRYATESCEVQVVHKAVNGITADGLKAVLDQHPEGIVLYCGYLPHAVLLTDYEGDTFYCAETVEGYSGERIPLIESWIGDSYGSQEAALRNVTAYWYITSYKGMEGEVCNCSAENAGTYICTTTTTDLLVRTGHGTKYSVVGSIPAGATVYVAKASGEGDGNWAHVYYEGVSGYASMKYLTKSTEEHHYESTVIKPTCEEQGYTLHVCKDCRHTYTDTPVEPLGHAYGSWMPGGEFGKEVRTCSRCGAAEERSAVRTGTITGDDLRIRAGAGTGHEIVGYLMRGDRVEILETKTVSGMTWGRISQGWISMDYVDMDEAETEPEEETPTMDPLTVTVEYYGVNIRKGPGTSYGIVGQANMGDRMTITEVQTGFGYTWGKFDGGWIALMYTNYEELLAQQPEEETPSQPGPGDTTPGETEPEETAIMGTVTGSDLRIRSGAGTSYSVVGFLQTGDRVEIFETKTVNGMTWGRIDMGWISLSYVDLDEAQQTPDTEPETKIVTVTADCLRVRSEADLSSSIVGFLYWGAKVEIFETKTGSGMTWGRTEKGWISMDYVI